MTNSAKTMTSDTAAHAAINAAARELHLPTVRAEAERMAEIAVRERQTYRDRLELSERGGEVLDDLAMVAGRLSVSTGSGRRLA